MASICQRHRYLMGSGHRYARSPSSTGRPFILYQDGSRLQFKDSTLQDLGSDVKGGLGVTWRNDTNAGGATGTLFTGNDVGAVVSKSAAVIFTGDTFAHNAHQGLVLTDKVAAPTVSADTFRGNAGDGMLVSSGVSAATISGDAYDGNGANGLHLDRVSGATTVSASTAEANLLAGFNVAGSNGVLLQRLTTSNDKVGIELAPGATNTHIDQVTLTGDRVGVEVADAPGVTLSGLTVRGRHTDRGHPQHSGREVAPLDLCRFASRHRAEIERPVLSGDHQQRPAGRDHFPRPGPHGGAAPRDRDPRRPRTGSRRHRLGPSLDAGRPSAPLGRASHHGQDHSKLAACLLDHHLRRPRAARRRASSWR